MPDPDIDIRAIPNTLITMADAPNIFNGKPIASDAVASDELVLSANGTVNLDEGDTGIPYTRHRWKISDLSGKTTGGKDRDDDEYWVEEWEEVGGGLKWKSRYPYRPRYFPRREFLRDNSTRVYTKALHFEPNYVEHMYINLGKKYESMTVMIACVFDSYWSNPQQVLDAGRKTPVFGDIGSGGSHNIDDRVDYRAAMEYYKKRSRTGAANKQNVRRGKKITARHHSAKRPKVLFTVFNGDDSLHGSIDHKYKQIRRGKLNDKQFRHLVLGRKRNTVKPQAAADMTIFEIRIWEGPLTKKQLKRQARRLASRYKFSKYWN